MSTGEQIRTERKRRGWSQRTLAKKSGVSLTILNQLETGKGNPSLRTIEKLYEALGLSSTPISHKLDDFEKTDADLLTPLDSTDESALVLAHELDALAQLLRDPAIGHETKRSKFNAFIVRYFRGIQRKVAAEDTNRFIKNRSRKP